MMMMKDMNVFGSDDDTEESMAVDHRYSSVKPVTTDASPVNYNRPNSAQQKLREKRRKRKDLAAEEQSPKSTASSAYDQLGVSTRRADDDIDPLQPAITDDQRVITKARPKLKRKKAHIDDGLFPVDSIQADIVHLKQNIVSAPYNSAGHDDDCSPKRQVWHTNVQSQPVGKIFVEHERGFKALEEWKLTQKIASSLIKMESGRNLMKSSTKSPALELGLSLHCYSKRLANYCHGILAGFALWQCIMVYRLTSPSFSSLDFVEHYSFMASLAQALFYVLTAICLVSVMGRCDVGSYSGQWFHQVRSFTAGFVALIAYFITLLLSLFVADVDENLALHEFNSTVDIEDSQIQTWKSLNLCRCLGAMTAWLALAVSPDHDLLYESVKALADDAQ